MQGIASSVLAWVGFCIFILLMLSIDLGVFNRRPHEIGYKNAALWSAVWITLAAVFAGLLFGPLGWELFGPARHQKAHGIGRSRAKHNAQDLHAGGSRRDVVLGDRP